MPAPPELKPNPEPVAAAGPAGATPRPSPSTAVASDSRQAASRDDTAAEQVAGSGIDDAASGRIDPCSDPAADPASARLLALLGDPQAWTQLVLAGPLPAGGAEADLQRVTVRPLLLRGQPHWQFTHRHATRDLVHNHRPAAGLALVAGWLGARFRHAHLTLVRGHAELRFGKRGRGHLILKRDAALAEAAAPAQTTGDAAGAAPGDAAGPETAAPTLAAHDRAKRRWVDPSRPWLQALGVTTAAHVPVPAMARKWKQINRFVEIAAGALARSPLAAARALTVVDFGAGRATLTFALHDWLAQQGVAVRSFGIELRPELVAEGNRIADATGMSGLRLVQGDVGDAACAPAQFDLMIALHACDTATDAAIHRGIAAGAQLIICSPCCHKQLRPQLLSPGPLRSVFAHGIHAEQQAEMITDTLRALLLQSQGYDTQVFEFVALEHTRKNKMILAVKRAQDDAGARASALAQVQELKAHFGISRQALLERLQPAA
jgi:hypothetical protein